MPAPKQGFTTIRPIRPGERLPGDRQRREITGGGRIGAALRSLATGPFGVVGTALQHFATPQPGQLSPVQTQLASMSRVGSTSIAAPAGVRRRPVSAWGSFITGIGQIGQQLGTAVVQAGAQRLVNRVAGGGSGAGATPPFLQIPPNPQYAATSMLPSLPALGAGAVKLGRALRVLPGAGRAGAVARRVGGIAGTAATTLAVGGWIYDQFGNPIRRRYKRMNAMNVKAMRRAIRRVKAGRKICQEIERQLPKRKSAAFTRKRKC